MATVIKITENNYSTGIGILLVHSNVHKLHVDKAPGRAFSETTNRAGVKPWVCPVTTGGTWRRLACV